MFNGVELGAVRWVMHDEDVHVQPVGKFHEILLDNAVRTGVEPPPSQRMTIVCASVWERPRRNPCEGISRHMLP